MADVRCACVPIFILDPSCDPIFSHSEIEFVYRMRAGMLYLARLGRQAHAPERFHFLRIPK